jgi:hypothetical protein
MVMGMARLIDADLLLQWVERLEAYNMGRESCLRKPKGLTPEGVRHMIDAMPEVDAVPVVRCKDCEYWMYEYDDIGLCVTDVPDIDGVQRLACDFCSYGERRTDERKADGID